MEHVWRTLPLRQIVIGTTIAFLVVGFSETLIFSVIAHLGHKPSFFGVVATLQGTGAIAGGVTAGALVRRLGEVKTVGLGLAMFGTCAALLALPSLPIVLLAFPVAGVGLSWLIVGFSTAVQTRTPLAIQGRVSAASDISISVAQTVSIATGAALSTVVDYRILLVVMAAVVVASAGYLATRRHDASPARAAEQLLT